MRLKFLFWLVGSILALGLVMRVGNAVMSYIALAHLPAVAAASAPIPKSQAQVPGAPDTPKQATLNLSVQGVDHGVLHITNRNKETYHGLLLRLIVGADFTSWTEVLRDIAPGETIGVRLGDITNDKGERFDPVWWGPGRYRPLIVIEGTLADGTKATAHWW